MPLGSQVRHYRQKLKLTLQALSELADVDIGTIGALEARGSRRSEFGAQLAAAMGLSLEQLLDETQDHPAAPRPVKQSRSPPAPSAAVVTVLQEPPAHYGWPFRHVSMAQWQSLNPDQRSQVEGFIMGMLASSKPLAAGAQ